MERLNQRLFARTLMPTDFERERFFRMKAGDTWYDDLAHFPWLQRTRQPVAYRVDRPMLRLSPNS